LAGKPKGKVPLGEDLGVDGRIILEWILKETGWEEVDWILLSRDRDEKRAVVNTVMNLWVPLTVRNFLTS
jgi:hypothetical protein